ncbi:MAG: hypothetical protein ACRD9R_22110, partial [Pyrinomonadaceae bacterium]
MSSGWQISAGRIFEWIRPAVFLLTVLVSAWTLRDAQKRGLAGYSALLWTLATLIFPAVAFPLYLALRLWFHEAPDELPEMAEAMTVPVAEDAEALVAEGDEPGDSRHEPVASPQPSDEAVTKKGPTGRASAEDMRSAIFSPSVGVP